MKRIYKSGKLVFCAARTNFVMSLLFGVFILFAISSEAQTSINPTNWATISGDPGSNGPSGFAIRPATTSPGVSGTTVSQFQRGGGISYNAASGRYNSKDWTTGTSTAATVFAANDYVYFSIVNTNTTELRLTAVSITGQASGTGPNTFGLMYKIGTGTVTQFGSTASSTASPSFSGSISLCPGETVTLYLCGWGGSAAGGTWSVNSATLTAQYASAVTASLTSNSPVFSPSPLTFAATAGAGVTAYSYSWAGPSTVGSTSSSTGTGTITPSSISNSGTYSVTVTDAWTCKKTATTSVSVTSGACSGTPSTGGTATAGRFDVCTGTSTTVSLGATAAPGTGFTYQWEESNDGSTGWVPVSGGSGSTTITYTTPDLSSPIFYRCKTTCTASSLFIYSTVAGITISTVSPSGVSATATPNPICAGSTLSLTGAATDAVSYSWSGPGSFTSTALSTSRTSIAAGGAGIYTLSAINGCGTFTVATSSVIVYTGNPTGLSAIPGANPICDGNTLTLTGTATNAVSYSWAGPGGFTAATATTSLTASTAAAGIYTLSATNTCGTATVTTASVVVHTATPTITSAVITSANPLCSGANLTLTGSATSATSFSWAGPAALTNSATAVASRTAINTTWAGIYTFTATNSCGSTTLTTVPLVVGSAPTLLSITGSPSFSVCAGNSFSLTANATSYITPTYSWRGPGLSSTTINPLVRATATTAMTGTYTLTAATGCGNSSITATYTVNPLPVAGTIVPVTPAVLVGTSITLTNPTATGIGAWSATDGTGSVTIDAGGVATGISIGSATISYAATTAAGCGPIYATRNISVNGPPASITSFTPQYGIPGSAVTITGTNFDPVPSNNIVYFGATKAIVNAGASTTLSLSVTVPVGATYAPISVTTSSNTTAYSDTNFTPVFDNSGFRSDSLVFKDAVILAVGATPYSGAIGDIDGDGKPDLVVNNTASIAGSGTPSIFVLRNVMGASDVISGSSFSLTNTLTGGIGSFTPNNVKLADIDGDGLLDIVVALPDAGYMIVYRNTTTVVGSPTFAANTNIPSGQYSSVAAIRDFDGDGKPDVALSSFLAGSSTINILPNTSSVGSISFGSTIYVAAGAAPSSVCIADLDHDGLPDVAGVNSGFDLGTGTYSGNTITVARNTSTYGTISFGTSVSLSSGSGPVDIAAGDIDNDGRNDLVVTNINDGNFSVFVNTSTPGTLTSSSFAPRVNYTSGNAPTGIAVADINGDGKLDVVVSNNTDNTVSMFRNLASGSTVTLSFASVLNFNTGSRPVTVTVGDLDADGYPDVVTGNRGTSAATANTITVIKNYPVPPIGQTTGSAIVCGGTSTTFTNTVPGGTWALSNTTVATITSGGVLTGLVAGTDTVIYYTTFGGDTSFAYTEITITPAAPVVMANASATILCSGNDLTLTGSVTGTTTYLWNGPDGFTSTDLNPAAITVGTASAGIYTLTASNSCGTITATTAAITINVTPTPTISGSAVIPTAGSTTLTINANDGDIVYYSWSGGGNSSVTLNASGASIFTVSPASTTTYTIDSARSLAGCFIIVTGESATVTIDMGCTVAPTAVTANVSAASLCDGGTLTLTGSATGGLTYQWDGPDGYLSTDLNPASFTVGTASAGVYTLTAFNACGSGTATVTFGVLTAPTPVSASLSVSTICDGQSITLTGSAPGATTYSWNYPEGGTSTDLNPSSITVTTLSAGIYTLTATNTCGSASATTSSLVVNTVPSAAFAAANPATLCSGDLLTLTASATDATTYSWNYPDGGSSTDLNPTAITTTILSAGVYTFTATNGCGNAQATTGAVVINILPSAVSADAMPLTLCTGELLTLTGSATNATSYSWSGPDSYSSTEVSPSFAPGTIAASGVYTLSAINGCGTVTATTAFVTVNGVPTSVFAAVLPSSVCVGNSFTLTGSAAGATSYSWSGPDGYTSTDVNPAAEIATATSGGVYTINATNSCGTSTATTASLVITTVPTGVVATSNATTLCAGQTLTLTGSPAGAISYQWLGPNGYSQTVRNPAGFAVNTLSAGVYTLEVTNVCGTTSNTTAAIVINTPPTAVTATATPTPLCAGATLTLTGAATDATTYSWRGPNTYTATGIPASRVTNSLSAGIYTLSAINGCGTVTATTASVTVDVMPSVTGSTTLTAGSTITLSYAPATGGTWSSSNPAVANVNVSGGGVSGFSAGTTNIVYSVTNSCGTNSATQGLTVSAATTTSGQLYYNSFDAGSLGSAGYTNGAVMAPGLSGGNWTASTSTTSFGGASGQSLAFSNSSGTPTLTLTMTIQPGYSLSLSSYSFWRQRSATGAQNYTLRINGTSVGSGTSPTSGTGTGTLSLSPAMSNLTGTVTVVLGVSGASGSGTFRVDDFTLTGVLVPGSAAPVVNPYPTSVSIIETAGTFFTVGAGGAASYQWQRNTSGISGGTWTNITAASGVDPAPGTYSGYTTTSTATTNTLTLAGVPLAWNGYGYRCVVTNSAGSSTSGAALLNVTVPPPCSGIPVAGSVTPASSAFCGSGSSLLTAPAPTAGGITYRWQSSADDTAWTDISGATSNIYNTPTVTATTYYRSVVTCTNTSDTSITSTSVITINPIPSISVTPSSGTFCAGTSGVALSASGAGTGGTYVWSPATGLSASTGANVTVNSLTIARTYTVTGTNTLTTCASAGTTTISYTNIAGLSVTPATSAICAAPGQVLSAAATTLSPIPLQTFEGTIANDGWTTSGTTAWAPVTLPFTWSTTTVTGTGSGTKAYMLDNRSGTITASQLISPAFSLADYATASISYNSFFDQGAATNDSANLAISIDGGTTWVSLWRAPNHWTAGGTYSMGSYANTISLTPYVGNTDVKIRFGYYKFGAVASWLFFVDNVAIKGTPAASAYTWSPAAGLSATTGSVTAIPMVTTTYTASVGGCAVGTASVTVLPLPDAGSIAASDTNICLGGVDSFVLSETGTPTGPAGTTFASYAWSGPAGYVSTAATSSVGNRTITASSVSQSGVYSLTVTYNKPGCTSLPVMTQPITVNPHPVSYSVTGGTACASTGITVGLTGSDTGITYQLYNNGAITGTPLPGTGSALDFGLQTIPGLYTLVATGTASCEYTMAGSDTVNALPTIGLGSFPSVCQPATSAPIAFSSATGTPSSFSLDWDATANDSGFVDVVSSALGSTIPLSIPTSGAVGTFNGQLTVSNNICVSDPYSVNVVVLPYPVASVTSVTVPCSGYNGIIEITGTPGNEVSYMVDSGTVATASISGSGFYLLNTGLITTPHNYTILNTGNLACPSAVAVDTVIEINPVPMTWVGGTGGAGNESDWSVATNWNCGMVPSVSDITTIGVPVSGFNPSVAASPVAEVRGLKLEAGSILTIQSGGQLNITGDLNNNGAISGGGRLRFNGALQQTITGKGTISNAELNNAAGALIDTGSRMVISQALYLTSGTLTTNDSLELGSNDTNNTARIAEIPASGAGISGKVKVDQYVQGHYRRYRFWSHPFDAPLSLGQIQKYIDITGQGGAANGFTPTTTNAPSAFRFDPLRGNDTLSYDPGWKPFTKITASAADSNKIRKHQGIRLFFRGAKGEGLGYLGAVGMYDPSSVVVKMDGYVNQGPQTVFMSQGSADPVHQSFNMIGNPYPSPVDIGTVIYQAAQTGNVQGAAFYVWDPTIGPGGNFIAIPIGTTAAIPYVISANTCFQVRTGHNGDSLNFVESDKAATPDNYLFKMPSQYTTLNVYDSNYHIWDALKLQFTDNATDAEDSKLDAVKILGSDFTFYSLSADKRKLAIDARPFDNDKTIPLGIAGGYDQQFIIRAENVAIPEGGKLYLHDKLLGLYTEMKAGAEYAFHVGKDKATQGDIRFELSLKPAAGAAADDLHVTMTPNPASDDVHISFTTAQKAQASVRVTDISGVSVYNKDLGTSKGGSVSVSLKDLAPGIYMVELTAGGKKVVQKLVKE